MKRLIIQYDFPNGDQDRLTNFFPFVKRIISLFKRHLYTKHFSSSLPAYYPAIEKPTVIISNPVGFFLKP